MVHEARDAAANPSTFDRRPPGTPQFSLECSVPRRTKCSSGGQSSNSAALPPSHHFLRKTAPCSRRRAGPFRCADANDEAPSTASRRATRRAPRSERRARRPRRPYIAAGARARVPQAFAGVLSSGGRPTTGTGRDATAAGVAADQHKLARRTEEPPDEEEEEPISARTRRTATRAPLRPSGAASERTNEPTPWRKSRRQRRRKAC